MIRFRIREAFDAQRDPLGHTHHFAIVVGVLEAGELRAGALRLADLRFAVRVLDVSEAKFRGRRFELAQAGPDLLAVTTTAPGIPSDLLLTGSVADDEPADPFPADRRALLHEMRLSDADRAHYHVDPDDLPYPCGACASLCLARAGGPAWLAAATADRRAEVAAAAASALAPCAEEAVVPALVVAAAHPSAAVRGRVAHALRRWTAHPAALAALDRLAADPSPRVRRQCVHPT